MDFHKILNIYFQKKGSLFVLSLLFLCAFGIRQYMALVSPVISPDGILYINNAKMIASGRLGEISSHSFFNLYIFLIVLFQKVFANWETAGRMVSVLSGSLTIIPLFLLIKRMMGLKVSIAASALFAINPRLVEYSADVLRESSFWFFSVTALWLAWVGITEKNKIYLVLSGLCIGLSIFSKIEGIAVLAVIVLWISWYFIQNSFNLRGLFINLLIIVITIPIVFLPPLYILKNKIGRWDFGLAGEKIPVLLQKNTNSYLEVDTELPKNISTEFRAFLDIAKRHKYVSFLSEVVFKFIRSFNVLFFVLFLFGVLRRKTIPYSKWEIPFVIWFFILFSSCFIYVAKTHYLSTRHGLLIGIPALIWTGIGFCEFAELIKTWAGKLNNLLFKVISKYSLVFLFALIATITLPKTLLPSGLDKIELKKAGLYLKDVLPLKTRITAEPSLYRVVFYSDKELVYMPPNMSLTELMAFLKNNNIEFLIVDERSIDNIINGFQNSIKKGGMEKIFIPFFETFKEYSIAVYKVK